MTMLEELTKGFPESTRLKVREALDRTRIRNPNDPIYELMIVLGIWGQYYESIPKQLRSVIEEAGNSLTPRLNLLKLHAQSLQMQVDRLEGVPRKLVELFPSEDLAQEIAEKIDDQVKALPLLQVERELKAVKKALESLNGEEGPGGLGKEMETTIVQLRKTIDTIRDTGLAGDWFVHQIIAFLIGLVVGIFVILFGLGMMGIGPLER